MDLKKTINEMRTLVSSLKFNSEEIIEDSKFLDITDKDGNTLRVETEELVIGEVIKMVTDDIEVSIPEMEITLEDGRTIKTDVDSKIVEITDAIIEEEVTEEEVTEPVAEEEMTEVETPELEVSNEEVETEVEEEIVIEDLNFENRITELENLIKELITNQNTMGDVQMNVITLLEEFGKTPVGDKNNLKTLFTKTEKKDTRDSALESIRNFRSK